MTVIEYGRQTNPIAVLLHGGGLSWWNYHEVAKLLEKDYHVILPLRIMRPDSFLTSILTLVGKLLSWAVYPWAVRLLWRCCARDRIFAVMR